MKDHIKDYKEHLEKKIGEYMEMPVNDRTSKAIEEMMECWEMLDSVAVKKYSFTEKDAEDWNSKMLNADGTTGGHWKVEQTTAVAQSMGIAFEHITPIDFNVAMNMMFSDYYDVAKKYNVDKPEFYACMAKDWLFDPDGGGPKYKLSTKYWVVNNKPMK